MDSNIVTLIEQSNKYNSSKTNFFKTKLFVSNNHSPNREYSKHVAQTENVLYNRYQSKEVNSEKIQRRYLSTPICQTQQNRIQIFFQKLNVILQIFKWLISKLFPKNAYLIKKVQIINLNSNFIKVLMLLFLLLNLTNIIQVIKQYLSKQQMKKINKKRKLPIKVSFKSVVKERVDKNGILFKSKLNLFDLAGSEKINKLEALTNAHFIELKNINQSLTTLGKVISNLSLNNKNKLPIPYKESKLTRLSQDSLGGNTMTHIIVNIAPNIYNIDETVSSLKFAQRAKNVTIQVQPNKFNANDQVLVNKLVKEIDYQKSLLNMKRSGLNQNDLHFKLMKIQEENERLREIQLRNDEVEKIIQENIKMNKELQKLQQQASFGDPSESNSVMERLQYLEQLQIKNEMTYSLLSSPSHFNSFQLNEEKKSAKYRLLEKQLIQKQ